MTDPASKIIKDEILVQEYIQGSPQAFNALFKRYQNRIFLVIRQYFPEKEKAEEVFQEVFMKVIEKLEKFDLSGSFRAWLFTVCRNHCIDRIRYYGRRPEKPESSIGNNPESPPQILAQKISEETPADEKLYGQQLAQAIQSALFQLPEAQRETFILRTKGGFTFEEIAEQMQESINTVKSRMRYALGHLRKILGDQDLVKEALS